MSKAARSDHVHSHPPWPVGVGELANEVGQGSIGDIGAAGLRRGFGTEMAADGDDPGPLDKPVLNSADETQQSAEFQRHRPAKGVWVDRGQRSGWRYGRCLDHHPDGPGHCGGDRLT